MSEEIRVILSRANQVLLQDYGGTTASGWMLRNRKYVVDRDNNTVKIDSAELDLIINIMSFAGVNGSFVSMNRLANQMGKTREAIRQTKARLVARGWLITNEHESGTHIYDFSNLFDQLIKIESFFRVNDPENKRFDTPENVELEKKLHSYLSDFWNNDTPQEFLGSPRKLGTIYNNSNYIVNNIISDNSENPEFATKKPDTLDTEQSSETAPEKSRLSQFTFASNGKSIPAAEAIIKRRGRGRRTHKDAMLVNIVNGLLEFQGSQPLFRNNQNGRKTYGVECRIASAISSKLENYYYPDTSAMTDDDKLRLVEISGTIVDRVAKSIRTKHDTPFGISAIEKNLLSVLSQPEKISTDDDILKYIEEL